MVDEYVVLDIITEAVEAANTGLTIWKGNSPKGEKEEHIVINHLPFNRLDYVGNIHVNVNIFIKQFDDGSQNIPRQKDLSRQVKPFLRKKKLKTFVPAGTYFESKMLWSQLLSDMKEGFDSINIRLEIITEKN
jgi:hypothetical protein